MATVKFKGTPKNLIGPSLKAGDSAPDFECLSGSLEVINRIAPADQRSEVVSSYLIALFAGNSVPVIGIGVLAAAATPLVAHATFAVVITGLAGIAAWTGIRYAPQS